MRNKVLIGLLACIMTLASSPSHALHSLEKYVSAKQLASPGLLIINPADGKVIAQNAPESLRVPASVLKLISTAAALHFVGPEKRYETTVFKTENADEYVIKGSLDPWLTSNLTLSKKNNQRFLPGLLNKANPENKKKITVYYSGLFTRDVYDLAVNLKAKKIKPTFKKIDSEKAKEIARDEIASVTSEPLSEMVKFTNLWSDNRLADRLANSAARKIGYETNGKGLTKTFALALSEIGVDHTGLKVMDGSGLSKSNRVSAKTIVDLLAKIRNNPTFESIYEGLPVGGITGTLQKRFIETAPNAIGNVRAKTGWVNHSVTMAGYVSDGENEFVFAILADGITPTLTSRNKARATMDRLLGLIVKGNH